MVESDKIIVKGAREHNLKNVNVEFPRNKFVVITGLSGSGKSSLAFDTIFSEGNRRYVESLSAYARQFLGNMSKPDVDSIEGLSPAISIEQKTTSKNPRSTVGTVTEIYDYLRLLFARVGKSHCPKCDTKIQPQSAQNIVNLILSEPNKKVMILAPIVRGLKGTYEKVFDDLKRDGFSRARVDGDVYHLDTVKEEVKLERYEKHYIEAVVDRITISEDERARITDSVEQALHIGKGSIIVLDIEQEKETRKDMPAKLNEKNQKIIHQKAQTIYSTFGSCPNHPEVVFEEPEPRQFSFNSPFGACPTCLGIGSVHTFDEDLIIPDKSLSVMDGAIAVYGKMDLKWRAQQLAIVGEKYGFDLWEPVSSFSKKAYSVFMHGNNGEPIRGRWHNGANMNMDDGWEGVIGQTQRLFNQTDSDSRKSYYQKFMVAKPCTTCHGKRLKENVLSVKIDNKSIIDITDFNIEEALNFFQKVEESFTEKEKFIAKQVFKEIKERLEFLANVGLGYLTLSRSAGTLSGGEAQRIRLATQIGANLMGVLYVLDEPSIGLHQRDNEKLINTLHKLRDVGNTLLVVEHDEDTMKAADYIIDMGPGAGVNGGHVVASGTPEEIMANDKSETGKYLKGDLRIEVPKTRRKPRDFVTLKGANSNNLQNVSVDFPTGILCGITGVSGSGKSTLTTTTLMQGLKKHFKQAVEGNVGQYKSIEVPDEEDGIIVIDQTPIGRTPRSNPATYIKVFDEIRKIFAATKEAKSRGYKEGRFSFNVKGGRCETCQGDGMIKIEMNFLPDVYVECEECKGKRYNRETLEVLYKGKTIADVLDMDVDTAVDFFENHSSIHRKVKTLQDVGLGYIKLGQSSTTLSGGESQRIKLTKELAKFKKGRTLYILDEPTTGLHFEDVNKLITVLNRLVDKGNSIYVIEHNLDVIKCCDHVIDMGPEGGSGGGQVVAQGTPEDIVKVKKSHTGRFLKELLNSARK